MLVGVGRARGEVINDLRVSVLDAGRNIINDERNAATLNCIFSGIRDAIGLQAK